MTLAFDVSTPSNAPQISRSIHYSQANLAGFEIGQVFFQSDLNFSWQITAAASNDNHTAFTFSFNGIVSLTGNAPLGVGLNSFKLTITNSNNDSIERDITVLIREIRQDTYPKINDFHGSWKYEEFEYPLWLYEQASWDSNKNNIALSSTPSFPLTYYNLDSNIYDEDHYVGQQVIHYVRQVINNLPDASAGVSFRTFVRSASAPGQRVSSVSDGAAPQFTSIWIYSRNPDRRVRKVAFISQEASFFTVSDGTQYAWSYYYYQYSEPHSNYAMIEFKKLADERVEIKFYTRDSPYSYRVDYIYGGSYYKLHTTYPDEYYPFWLIDGTDFSDANKFNSVAPLSTTQPAGTSLQGWNIDDQFSNGTIYPAGQITQQLESFALQLMRNEPDKTAYRCKFNSASGDSNGKWLIITKFTNSIELTIFANVFNVSSTVVGPIKTNTNIDINAVGYNGELSLVNQGNILYNRGRFGDNDGDSVTLTLNYVLIDGINIGNDKSNYSIQTSNDTFSFLKDSSITASTATYTFNITATSSNGSNSPFTSDVVFGVEQAPNNAPTITANAQSNTVLYSNRDQQPAIYIDGTVSDAENDAITLSLTSGTLDGSNIANVNDSYEVSLNGSLFSVSAKAGVSISSGVYVFTVQASDGTDTTTANVQATIKLQPVISTSTINVSLHHLSLNTQNTSIGTVIFGSENLSGFTIGTSEQQDNNHTAFAINNAGQVTLTGTNAVTSGNNSFKLTITDTNGLQSEQIVTVDVTVTNQTPTIVANAQNIEVAYNNRTNATLLFSGTFADADNDPVTMTLLSGTFDGGAVNNADFLLAQSGNNFTITSVNPYTIQTGTYVFEVQASDGNLTQQASAQVGVKVKPSLEAQSFDLSIHHLRVQEAGVTVGTVVFSAEDSTPNLNIFNTGSNNNHLAFSITNQGVITLSGNNPVVAGPNSFLLQVYDGNNNTWEQQVMTVNVTITNQAPTIVANAQNIEVAYNNRTNATLLFSGTFADADNDPVTMTLLSGTFDGGAVNNADFLLAQSENNFTITSVNPYTIQTGTYVFQVQASDGNLTQQASAQVGVKVKPSLEAQSFDLSIHHLSVNQAGVTVGTVVFSAEDSTPNLNIFNTGSNNNHLAFSITNQGVITLSGNNPVVAGPNSFLLQVYDGTNNTWEQQVMTVNVTITNQTPTIVANAQSKEVLYNNRTEPTLLFSGTFADADNDPVTMTLLSGTFDGGAVNNADFLLAQSGNNFTITSVNLYTIQTGTYVFQVQASDGNLTQQASARVDITVKPSLDAQTIDLSIHHLFVNVNGQPVGNVSFALEGTAVTSNFDALPLDQSNPNAFIVSSQGAVTLSGNNPVVEGSQVFLLRVTDSVNGSYTDAVITVNVTITNTTPAISGPSNTLSTAYSNRSSGLLIYQNGIFADADSDPVTVTLLGVTIDGVAQDVANFVLTASNGSFSINSVPNYTMTSGAVVFSVSATDQRDTASANVSTTYKIIPEIGLGQQFNLDITAVEERDGNLGLFQVVGQGESALSYSLNSLTNLFAIEASTGILKTKGDGELISNGTYTISVTVTDTSNSTQATTDVSVIATVSRVVGNKSFSNVITTVQSMNDVTVGQNCVITAVNNNLSLSGTISIDASSVIGDSDDVIVLQNSTVSGGRFNYVSMGGSGSFTNCQFVGPTGLVQTLAEGAILTLYNSNI